MEAVVVTQAEDAGGFDKGGDREEGQKEMDVNLSCK